MSETTEYSQKELQNAFQDAQLGIFTFNGGYGCFLASIMANTEVRWDTKIASANTNGIEININPDFFMQLSFKSRQALLLHELWHIAKLHAFRREERDHKHWNDACDISINNMLMEQGFDIPKMGGLYDKSFSMDEAEEAIYAVRYMGSQKDKAPKNNSEQPDLGDVENDLQEPPTESPQDKQQLLGKALQKLVQADQAAKAANEKGFEDLCQGGNDAGDMGGDSSLYKLMNDFLHPKIQWYMLLRNYLKEISTSPKRTWTRRSRRYPDVYLPGTIHKKNKLEHLAYFLDVSGSITEAQVKRFNTEVRYIKQMFNPKKLTLIQFDTEILRIDEYTDKDKFENIHIVTGGGTSYTDVHDYIEEHKPTCAIIFTDLYCTPMEPVSSPVIWVAVDSEKKEIPFGKLVSINSEDI